MYGALHSSSIKILHDLCSDTKMCTLFRHPISKANQELKNCQWLQIIQNNGDACYESKIYPKNAIANVQNKPHS